MNAAREVYQENTLRLDSKEFPGNTNYPGRRSNSRHLYILYEITRLLSCVTFRKLLNQGKLIISYWLSQLIKYPIQWGLPSNIAIEPTSVCNLACPECPSGNGSLLRRRGNISWSLFEKSIGELKPYLFSTTLYFQGEPFLNPQLFDMLAYLKKQKIYSIISTNAQFLSPKNCDKLVKSGLNRIIISLDGLDQASYSGYRVGGSYHKAIEGIENLVRAKKENRVHHPVIFLQFLVFRHNQHQIGDVKVLGKKLGVDKVTIKASQIYDFENNAAMIPTIPRYSRYNRDAQGHYQLRGKIKDKCWRSWQNPVITVDGDLLPCCFDKDAQHAYGNVKREAIQSVWHSKDARQFKHSILKNRQQHDICRNCTEGIRYNF